MWVLIYDTISLIGEISGFGILLGIFLVSAYKTFRLFK